MKESKGMLMVKSNKRKEKKQKNPCNCGVGKGLGRSGSKMVIQYATSQEF